MKNQEKPFTFRGKILLLIVMISYSLLFLASDSKALSALQKSSAILVKILPIFIVVILFTALLNYYIQPHRIAGHLGKESGVKGWLWALATGIISHGPMYGWYPLIEDLRSHGMKDSLIVVFFSSRVIKLPLLPIMIDYFGWTFTLVLSFYILLGALAQGLVYERIERMFRQA